MKFTYHKWLSENRESQFKLKDISTDIKRGSITFKDLKRTRQPYFHTTHFKTGTPENKNTLPDIRKGICKMYEVARRGP